MTESLGWTETFPLLYLQAVCKDAWDRQHLTASYYKLLEVISCWIDAWDSQHDTGFLLCITTMVADFITVVLLLGFLLLLLILHLLLLLPLIQLLLQHLCIHSHVHFHLPNSSPSSSPTSTRSGHCWTATARVWAHWAPLDLNLGPSELSEHRWTSTWDRPSSVSTAGLQPGTLRAQWAPLDLNLGPSELSEHRWTSKAR